MQSDGIRYISSRSEKADYISKILEREYDIFELTEDDSPSIVIVLSGDGFMLESIRKFIDSETLLYGINCGNVGFLLNDFNPDSNLIDDINGAFEFNPKILRVDLESSDCKTETCYAINDFYLIRRTQKAVHLKIFVDSILRLERLIGDGAIISTPFGSTAYNSSAGGPILPIDSNMVVFTPINAFSPRNLKGVILNDDSKIRIEVVDYQKRPVNGCADLQEFSFIKSAEISKEKSKRTRLLFKSREYLHNKSIIRQFS